jgi:RNA polymerase sigma factor (sigma-70 family)
VGSVSELRIPRTDVPWQGLDGTERHAACLTAARAGNSAALDVLVAELTPLVWHVARGRGLDRGTAEDVVQTVWLSLLKHLDRLEQPRALVGWLITTTRRESHRTWQRRTDHVEFKPEVVEQVPSAEPQPEAEALRHERDQQLWAAFGRLSERCQELLRLTVLAGRAEYRSVAEALHMPHGSIGPTRGRCLTSLRALLDEDGGAR